MLRKLAGLFAMSSAIAAQPTAPPDLPSDSSKIYPYVVPGSYFDTVDRSKSVTTPLGHGLEIALVNDFNGLVRNIRPEELPSLGLTQEQAKKKALENLEALSRSGAIGQRRFVGPDQKPFVLFGGHWATATCILLPTLRELGIKNVGSDEICVSIPNREALLMFPRGDQAYRDTMVNMIKERESDNRKPLTFRLFELTSNGIKEVN
jgi:hypothetical protein